MHLWAVVLAMSVGAHRPKVAVLDVQDIGGGQAEHARLLTQIVAGEVARGGQIEVITSEQIRQLLGFERQKALLGCGESSCLAELGGALGADYLLSGQIGKLGSRFRLDLTLIDAVKAQTRATQGDFLPAQEDALAEAAVTMVNQLLVQGRLRDAATAALATQRGGWRCRTRGPTSPMAWRPGSWLRPG